MPGRRVEFCQKTFKSNLAIFRKVLENFEFFKLGRFGSTFYDRGLVSLTWVLRFLGGCGWGYTNPHLTKLQMELCSLSPNLAGAWRMELWSACLRLSLVRLGLYRHFVPLRNPTHSPLKFFKPK